MHMSHAIRRMAFTPAQVLVMGFAALIAIGTGLLMLPAAHEAGRSLTWVDALFTATSAVCVTGLIVVDTATQFSLFGELVILGLVHAGGLGIMTLSVFMLLLIGRRVSLQERIMMQEAMGSHAISGVVRLTRHIFVVTVSIEAIGMVLLAIHFLFIERLEVGRALYMALFHTITAFNNAGFDVTGGSLRPFAHDPLVLIAISGLVAVGSLGFPVVDDLWRNKARWEKLTLHSRVVIKVGVIMILAAWAFYALTEWSNPHTFGPMPWYHKLINAFFTAIVPRTAGFESIATTSMRDVSLLITILLMFVGAAPGGTGGGIKTTTFAMIMLAVRATAKGTEEVIVMGRSIARDLIDKAMVIATLSVLLVIVISGALLVTEMKTLEDPSNPISMIRVLFEVVSGFGTAGLSAGLTPLLTVSGKLLMIVTMFVGRVGPLTVAVALAQRKNKRTPIHYPEDRVMIG
jgi:trk system potassium uptake protein